MAGPLLNTGTSVTLLDEQPAVAGTRTAEFNIQSDAALVGLVVRAITGTLSVSLYAQVDGQQALLLTFPLVSAPTPSCLLRRTATTTGTLRAVITYTGAADYAILARAVSTGPSDTKILGAGGLRTTRTLVGLTPVLLIPAAFQDRAGLIIRNVSTTAVLTVAESAAQCSAAGYPLFGREALSIDVAGGQDIWGVSTEASTDVAIMEAGG